MNDQMEIGGPGAAITRRGEVSVPSGPVDMARIVALAESGVDPESVGKLVDLYERIHGIQAEQAFNEAMLAVQKAMRSRKIPMRGRVVVSKSGTKRPYPLLEDIQDALADPCAENGISYSFDTETSGKAFVVIMRVSHVMGVTREVRTTLPLDESGSKNQVQGVGSTESYGMRYCIIKGFGLVRYLHDDDGAGDSKVETDTVDEEELANLQAVYDEVKKNVDEKAFLAYYGIGSLSEMPQVRYREALEQLQRRRK